jgi:hypothetical protein
MEQADWASEPTAITTEEKIPASAGNRTSVPRWFSPYPIYVQSQLLIIVALFFRSRKPRLRP